MMRGMERCRRRIEVRWKKLGDSLNRGQDGAGNKSWESCVRVGHREMEENCLKGTRTYGYDHGPLQKGLFTLKHCVVWMHSMKVIKTRLLDD